MVFPDVDLRLIRLQICTNAAFMITSARRFGDCQGLKLNPRKAAEEVLGHLDISEVARDPNWLDLVSSIFGLAGIVELFFKPLYPDRLLLNP